MHDMAFSGRTRPTTILWPDAYLGDGLVGHQLGLHAANKDMDSVVGHKLGRNLLHLAWPGGAAHKQAETQGGKIRSGGCQDRWWECTASVCGQVSQSISKLIVRPRHKMHGLIMPDDEDFKTCEWTAARPLACVPQPAAPVHHIPCA